MNELEERARRVLEVARSGHDPSPADAQRVHVALKARVLADPASIEPRASEAWGSSGVLAKVLSALGAGAMAGFAVGFYVAQAMAPGASSVPPHPTTSERAPNAGAGLDQSDARRPRRDAGASEATPAAPDEAASKPDVSPHATRARLQTKAQPTTRLALPEVTTPLRAELDGLRRAQELLHQGHPAWALARLAELDRAHASSALLEERAATRAIAECRLGHGAAATAGEFARRFPSSAFLERVRSSCSAATHIGATKNDVAPAQTENTGSRHEQ